MKNLIISLAFFLMPVMSYAQTYFYHNPNNNCVVVVYVVNSNKIVRDVSYYSYVRERLMENINAYEERLSKHSNHAASYDMNAPVEVGTCVRACNYLQNLSGYDIYGFAFTPGFMYGRTSTVLDLGISSDFETVVTDITKDKHQYFSRVPKSFFLPSL